MPNVFDQLNGLEDGYEENLGGLFSKIKKRLKKTVKKVRNITSKVGKKVLPSSIRKLGRKLDKSGITKLAAGAALFMVGGPAIAAGLKGSKIAAIAGKAVGAAKAGIGTIKVGSAAGAIKTGAKLYATSQGIKMQQAQANAQIQAQEQAAAQAQYDAKVSLELSKAMGASPEFEAAVAQLRAQGYSDDAILQHWVESKSYYQAAVPQVAKTIYPQVLNVAQQSGFTGQDAADLAYSESFKIADQEVKKTQSNASNLTPLLLAAGAALLFKL